MHATSLDSPSIPITYSRIVARELGLHSKELPLLLTSTPLTVEQFLEEDTRLTPMQQISILENALSLTEEPAFGLSFGQRLTPSTHGAMGFLSNCSSNLLEAFEALLAYAPTRMSFIRLDLNKQGEQLIFECLFDRQLKLSPAVNRCISEMCAMVLFSCAETIIGRPAYEIEICFPYPQPDYAERYAHFLPGKVRFAQGRLVAFLPATLGSIENVSGNRESYLMAKAQCEVMLAQLRSNVGGYQRKVEKMILSNPTGLLSEEEAAAALFISKRTLARHLKAEGTRFREVRDTILARQASHYLRNAHLSVDAIAALLHYHDSASFRRAFKRWFQMTPDRYRRSVTDAV